MGRVRVPEHGRSSGGRVLTGVAARRPFVVVTGRDVLVTFRERASPGQQKLCSLGIMPPYIGKNFDPSAAAAASDSAGRLLRRPSSVMDRAVALDVSGSASPTTPGPTSATVAVADAGLLPARRMPPPAPSATDEWYTVAFDFQAESRTELSVVAGSRCRVLRKNDEQGNPDWWLCECNGQSGYVAAAFIGGRVP